MSFAAPKFTSHGKNLQLRALDNEAIVFTKIQMGDGQLGATTIESMTALQHPVVTLGIRSISVSDDGYATITAAFDNSSLSDGFYWREIGLFAEDPDDRANEILYCYQNSGDLANYIAEPGSEIIEKLIKIIAVVDDAENVTAILNESAIFATINEVEEEFDDHNNDLTAHDLILGDVTLYVDAAASFEGIGTLSSPFKTITAAVAAAPQSARSVTIIIKSGNYAESVTVTGYRNITFKNYTGASVSVNSLDCSYCGAVEVSGITFTSAGIGLRSLSLTSIGITKLSGSNAFTASGTDTVGLYAANADVFVQGASFSNSGFGIKADDGARITVTGTTIAATVTTGVIACDGGTVYLASSVTNSAATPQTHTGGLIISAATASNISLGAYDTHLSSTNNPHDVSPAQIGFAYGETTDSASPYTVTATGFTLKKGGFVAVKFGTAPVANATLNVNGSGAKAIWLNGAAITSGVIKSGNTVLLCYDGTRYIIVANNVTEAIGTLPVEHGGTGKTTLPAGGVLVGSGTNMVSVLTGNGAFLHESCDANPKFGTLPIHMGGTGRITTGIYAQYGTTNGVKHGSYLLPGGILIMWGKIASSGNRTYSHSFSQYNGANFADNTYALSFSGQDDVWGSITKTTSGFSIAVSGIAASSYVADWIAIGVGESSSNSNNFGVLDPLNNSAFTSDPTEPEENPIDS